MSTAQVPVIRPRQPAQAPLREEPRRRFVIVPTRQSRRARPKVLHAVVAVAGVLVIVGAQLLTSIWISGGAYQINDLQTQERVLERQQVALDEQVDVRASTQYLAQAAASLGMVQAKDQFYLDLTDGKVTQAPGVVDPWGCGGACNLATNVLIAGLPLPSADGAASTAADGAATDAAAVDPATEDGGDAAEVTGGGAVAADTAVAVQADGAAQASTAAGATAVGPDGAGDTAATEPPIDPNAPVVADTLPGVVTH